MEYNGDILLRKYLENKNCSSDSCDVIDISGGEKAAKT